MTLSKSAWRAIALIVAAGLFAVAMRDDVYHATSPRSMAFTIFGPDALRFPHPWWLSLHIWVRKTYSIIAFMLVGFTLDRALRPTARPALRAATIVAVYSLGIEIAQHTFVAPEPALESVLDVGCGALGGWLTIVADRSISRASRRQAVLRVAGEP